MPAKPVAIDIAGMTSAEFAQQARERQVVPDTSLRMYRAAFRQRLALADWIELPAYRISRTQQELQTTKFALDVAAGLESESVILPIEGSSGNMRHTLCVSSQIGCAMGCQFCETAQMGLMRNLSASQIVAQWFAARFDFRTRIDNIVFMGMGEPMDNLDAVIQAIRVLCDRNAAAIAPARISVSTVGIAEGIMRLASLARTPGFGKLRLAVSINAPNDDIRSKIMPINRATPMHDLLHAMQHWPTVSPGNGGGRQRILIEYVLIPGVNDELSHADELCTYLQPLRSTVNVIPYNPRRESPWSAPDDSTVRAFIQRVHDNGQFVKRRQTMGRSVMAACGQLGNERIRKRKLIDLSIEGR